MFGAYADIPPDYNKGLGNTAKNLKINGSRRSSTN